MVERSRRFRGIAQHALFWAAASCAFLLDDRPDTSLRVPLAVALGLTLIAAAVAARTAPARDRRRFGRIAYVAVAVLVLGLLALHGAYLRSVGGPAISDAEFEHGYYLPLDRVQQAMAQGGPATARLAEEMKQIVANGRFNAITYDAELQPFVGSKLDGFLASRGLRRYSWDTSIDAGKAATDPAAVAAMVRNRRLDALLVKFPSDFWM